MFLRSARNAEFNVPQSWVDEAMDFVHRCWVEDDGLFHYTTWGSQSSQYTRGLMGSAIVSLSLAGQHESPQALAAGDWLLAHPYQAFGQKIGRGDRFYYSTYYCSQAAAQLGGRYWKGIYPPIVEILVGAQQADGSFPSPDSTFIARLWRAGGRWDGGSPVWPGLHDRDGGALADAGVSASPGLSTLEKRMALGAHLSFLGGGFRFVLLILLLIVILISILIVTTRRD